MVSAALVSVAAALVTCAAEWLHSRRTARAAYLAFGPAGRGAAWTRAVPFLSAAAVGAACFGGMTLWNYDPSEPETRRSARASQRVLICLDVSPSMQIPDSGAEGSNVSRARWAGYVLRSILVRLDPGCTRTHVIGFYTSAVPILVDTWDLEVVAHVLDGMPLYSVFERGETDIAKGIEAALEIAEPWARSSTTLVVVSDGDVGDARAITRAIPPAIADVLVVGVGDPNRVSQVSGHSSRQDAGMLKRLATELGGNYFDASSRLVPVGALRSLRMAPPSQASPWTDGDLGLVALASGALVLALIGPALGRFGTQRRQSGRRPQAELGSANLIMEVKR